ncbi:MAG TPA: hypothetical protein VGD83_29720 [Streptosporangiaceae bacterium]
MVSLVSFLDENARRDPDYRLHRPHPDRYLAAGQRKLILKLGPLVDAVKPGFHGVRTPALDPGFHGVPAGPAPPDREADGADVT